MLIFRVRKIHADLFIKKTSFYLLFLFLLFFPKGGFKIGTIPITWGYLLLGVISVFCLFQKTYVLNKSRIYAFIFSVPFQLIASFCFFFFSIEQLPTAISFIVNFYLLPVVFFLLLSRSIDEIDETQFFSLLKKGVYFVSCYGIFLFFYKILTGEFIQIPFLTMNYHDLDQLESKHINRGYVFKLISTYNNGNLYGVCILMLLPLYCLLEKKWVKKSLVKLSLLLTFSRTIWIGLFIYEIFFDFFVQKKKKLAIIKISSSISFLFLFLYLISEHYKIPLSFFLDVNLGGRLSQIQEPLNALSLFPSHPFTHIPEIAYMGILHNFGVIGFFAFLACMLGAILIKILIKQKIYPFDRGILCGLFLYLILSFSDGAMELIPVMTFYWFLSSLLLRKTPLNIPKL